jgi:outer membrane protein TolC
MPGGKEREVLESKETFTVARYIVFRHKRLIMNSRPGLMRISSAILAFLLICFISGASADETGQPLTVSECVISALKNHPDIRAARGNIDVSKAKIMNAASARYPQITSNSYYYRYAYQQGSGASPSTQGITASGMSSSVSSALTSLFSGFSSMGGISYYDYYTGTVTLNQMFFDFGKTRNNVIVASEGLNAAQYDLITKELQIVLQAKQAFYKAVSDFRIVQVKEEAVSQQQEHLDQAEAFFKQGVKAKIDVTKAEVDLAKAKLDLIKAKNSYDVSLAKLSNAMGLGTKPTVNYSLQDSTTVKKVKAELPKLIEQAVANRPELKKLAANIRSNVALKKVAEVQNLPNIYLTGSYNWQGSQFPLPFYYYFGTQITFTLFDGYLANAKAREAEGNVTVLKAQVDSQMQDINLDVKQSYTDLVAAVEAVEVSEKSLQQAQENYDLAKGRYNTGVGSSIEFTDARVSLTGAKSDYITAVSEYKSSVAKLEKAIGVIVDQ